MRRYRLLLFLGSVVAAGAAPVGAETVTYSYDALGRLRTSSVSGSPDSSTNTAICRDPASNRERYLTTIAGAASCAHANGQSPVRGARPNRAPSSAKSAGPLFIKLSRNWQVADFASASSSTTGRSAL